MSYEPYSGLGNCKRIVNACCICLSVIVFSTPATESVAQERPEHPANKEILARIETDRSNNNFIVRPGTPVPGLPPRFTEISSEATHRPNSAASPPSVLTFGPTTPTNVWNVGERRPDLFYPDGFKEVLPIVVDKNFHCSSSAVSRTHVLTAAHCVTNASGPRTTTTPADKILVFDRSEPGQDCYKTREPASGSSSTICQGKLKRVESVAVHPKYAESGQSPKYDVAVLSLTDKLHFDVVPAQVFSIPAAVSGSAELTIAGYGYTGLPGDVPGDALEVGWQKGKLDLNEALIKWPAYSDNESTTCNFDSGGPIYLGTRRGYIGEPRQIVGNVVGLVPDSSLGTSGSVIEACQKGTAVNTALREEPVLSWLCKILNNLECPK